MYEYTLPKFTLQELFDPDLPNCPALWAVLKGNYSGKALVDDEHQPSQCVLRTDAALSYFSRNTSQAFLDEAVDRFKKVGSVWLVWPQSTSLLPPAIENGKIIERLEFYDYDPKSEVLSKLRSQLPEGYTIQRIDRKRFEKCDWRTEMEFYAGSASSFLKHGIGLCLMRENEIIVEAYASALGKTRAEIGAITREAYRRRGYASIACAYLIQTCENQGYQAYWSCDADHQASIRVAQKLGFRQARGYQIFEYDSL